ncbi:Uncharacterised protein [Candidatus Gugararchaeum adminiculabundum]|nr:Uncharacterised protein [Candidatus Gugararchaeum adminiculabundum]
MNDENRLLELLEHAEAKQWVEPALTEALQLVRQIKIFSPGTITKLLSASLKVLDHGIVDEQMLVANLVCELFKKEVRLEEGHEKQVEKILLRAKEIFVGYEFAHSDSVAKKLCACMHAMWFEIMKRCPNLVEKARDAQLRNGTGGNRNTAQLAK